MKFFRKSGIVLSLTGILSFSGISIHYSNQIESLARESGLSNSSEFLPEQDMLYKKMKRMESRRKELYRNPEKYQEYKKFKERYIDIRCKAEDAQNSEDRRYLSSLASEILSVSLFLSLSRKRPARLPIH
jgi:hypothetical protein